MPYLFYVFAPGSHSEVLLMVAQKKRETSILDKVNPLFLFYISRREEVKNEEVNRLVEKGTRS